MDFTSVGSWKTPELDPKVGAAALKKVIDACGNATIAERVMDAAMDLASAVTLARAVKMANYDNSKLREFTPQVNQVVANETAEIYVAILEATADAILANRKKEEVSDG